MTHNAREAEKNVPDGWTHITSGVVEEGDMLWSCGSLSFELENHRSNHIGNKAIEKIYVIRKTEETRSIKVRFKSLKKVLKENPELLITKDENLGTVEQIKAENGQWTLNSVWVSNLGKDYTFHARTTLMESLEKFIEREYDDTHILTWDRIDKTKESWITVKELLDDKDYEGAGIQFELLRDHIAVIISKLHHYDRNAANNDKGIETRDKLLEKKNHEIDSLQCVLDMSKIGYEATIKDLRTQLGSIDSNSKETIMKRKFIGIVKRAE